MSFIEKKVAISELLLWNENARFPDQYYSSNEIDLIKYFVLKPDFKIQTLIEEIILDSDLPQLEKIVVLSQIDKLIVVEGNRRLTAYKLLANPDLIKELDQKLYEFLLSKSEKHKVTKDFQLECVISEDKDECYRFIDRKHAKGNNQVNWLEPERVNYSKRRGVESQNEKLKVAITKFVRELELPTEIKDEILGQGYVTTFYRIVTTGPAKEAYGLSTDENGDLTFVDPLFPEALKVIIHNVLRKEDFEGNKVDSRNLNKNQDIGRYLKKVNPEHSKKVDKEIKDNTNHDIFGKASSTLTNSNSKANKGSTVSNSRKTPISKESEVLFGRTLMLSSGKVNDLYRAISGVYEKNRNDSTILPIIGMSLRLITEVAARVYFEKNDPDQAKKDQLYNEFLKIAKKEMSLEQASKNYLSLTSNWLDGGENLEGILAKFAHGNITTTKDGVLKSSRIIGEILEYYFKKN